MNALLESIATNAADDLIALITEGEADILTAIHKMQAEAQIQETAPKFNLGFKIVVDFDKGTYNCDLSWTLKQSLSVSHDLEDPNQGKLPIDNSDDKMKVTLTSGELTTETTLGGMKRAVKMMKKS